MIVPRGAAVEDKLLLIEYMIYFVHHLYAIFCQKSLFYFS